MKSSLQCFSMFSHVYRRVNRLPFFPQIAWELSHSMDCIDRQMEEERFAYVVLFPVNDKVDRMLQAKIANHIAPHFRIVHDIVPTGLRIDQIEAWH